MHSGAIHTQIPANPHVMSHLLTFALATEHRSSWAPTACPHMQPPSCSPEHPIACRPAGCTPVRFTCHFLPAYLCSRNSCNPATLATLSRNSCNHCNQCTVHHRPPQHAHTCPACQDGRGPSCTWKGLPSPTVATDSHRPQGKAPPGKVKDPLPRSTSRGGPNASAEEKTRNTPEYLRDEVKGDGSTGLK